MLIGSKGGCLFIFRRLQARDQVRGSMSCCAISRLLLTALLVLMPWVALSSAMSPPSARAFIMHVSALAGLCTLACLAFEKNIQRAGAVLFVFVYGLVMEWLQNFSLDRHGTMEDVAANAMGCLAGVLLYFTIRGLHGLKRRCAIKQPKETKE